MTNRCAFTIRDLEQHIPTTPMSAREIAKRVDLWSVEAIKAALLKLWKDGKINRRTDDSHHGGRAPQNLYWRVP